MYAGSCYKDSNYKPVIRYDSPVFYSKENIPKVYVDSENIL